MHRLIYLGRYSIVSKYEGCNRKPGDNNVVPIYTYFRGLPAAGLINLGINRTRAHVDSTFEVLIHICKRKVEVLLSTFRVHMCEHGFEPNLNIQIFQQLKGSP